MLYYWRGDTYRHDLDRGAVYSLSQGTPVLHDISIGDSLWAFIQREDGAYVLAAELMAKAVTRSRPGHDSYLLSSQDSCTDLPITDASTSPRCAAGPRLVGQLQDGGCRHLTH